MTKNGHVKHGDWFFGTHEPWCVCWMGCLSPFFHFEIKDCRQKGQSQFEFLGFDQFQWARGMNLAG